MAEVYDPSNPYGGWVEDPSDTGAQMWDPYFYGWDPNYFAGLDASNPFTSVDASNPYDTAPTGVYLGGTLTGDLGTNPFGTSFGDTTGMSIDPYAGPTGENNGLPTTFPGFEELLQQRPTQYPGSQWPNIAIGIPGIIGIGAGGIVTGGLLDLLGGDGGDGSYGGIQQSGGGGIAPLPGDYGDSGATVGPGAGGQEQTPTQGTVYPLPGDYGDGASVGPGEGGGQGNPNTIYPLPGVYEDSGATVTPNESSPTDAGTIVPVTPTPPPNVPGENPQPNVIVPTLPGTYTGPVAGPVAGGGGTGSTPPPATTGTTFDPINRNYYAEGRQGVIDLSTLAPYMAALYSGTAQQYGESDFARYNQLLGGGVTSQLGIANRSLSDIAAAQTAYANQQLRQGNLGDVGANLQTALGYRQQANPELYAGLNRLDAAAGQQAGQGGSDFLTSLLGGGGLKPGGIQTTLEEQAQQGLALGRNLSAEDIRMSQQAAREAGAARGRLADSSTMAAEILNRDAISRQRENERRAFAQSVDQAGFAQRAAAQQGNIGLGQAVGGMDLARQQQAYNQLMGAAQMRSANAFDPFATLLGAQYGMQSSNVGTNQQLFGQGTGFSSGAFGNQYVQNAFNPYNNYAADVYGSNFNAANARQIASSNNAAAAAAAQQALIGSALGSLFKTGVETNWRFGF